MAGLRRVCAKARIVEGAAVASAVDPDVLEALSDLRVSLEELHAKAAPDEAVARAARTADVVAIGERRRTA